MNAVEIADAVAQLAEKPFSPTEFPFEFLAAFGNKETTITRLRKGDSNASDVAGGVLQKNNIHLAVCSNGKVGETLRNLRASPKTASAKAKFILATDGETLEAEELKTGDPLVCDFPALADNFGFFLPLAGISTVTEIKENPIDVRATGRLNKLYVELLRTNEDWQTEQRRTDLNHFFARLIFCFFAEDTHIFHGDGMFTDTVTRMSNSDGSNVDFVLSRLFGAMNLNLAERKKIDLPLWADKFPYVNGGLFSDELPMPRFTRTARSYLLRAGELNWRQINPDIFGSMIQAVADDEERGALGMHYTSVPNILKVLNPLFLDDLREQLEKAGDHKASLLKLRERMSRIRVFDPACGSGNFLVIAYKGMRKIEAEINRRRGEQDRASEIPPTNFRGIEIRDFAAEVARLALVIAEYQCDVLHRGERLALAEFLPLNKENWIYRGNALLLNWLEVCPPEGTGVKVTADNLFEDPLEQIEIDFANTGGEVFVCGNPPYKGSQWQTSGQKRELAGVFEPIGVKSGSLDYVAGWFIKAAFYAKKTGASTAFVSTNSICQGRQVETLWKSMFALGQQVTFAYTSFKWSNLASHKAGVIVVIIGLSGSPGKSRSLFTTEGEDRVSVREVGFINAYLAPGANVMVQARSIASTQLAEMQFGNHPYYGGALIMSKTEARDIVSANPDTKKYLRPLYGSQELISGIPRACLWIDDDQSEAARGVPSIAARLEAVTAARMSAHNDAGALRLATRPWSFREHASARKHTLVVPRVSSESRQYLPIDLLDERCIIQDQAFALYDAPLWSLALIASRLHLVWIATVCGKLKTDYRYSNTLGWNTFPVPPLTERQKQELTRYAQEILLAREAHFPATIADLYAPDAMPENLRIAHERNDETLERIYIGRRFRNDTERLEKLFEMYTAMTAKESQAAPTKRRTKKTTVAPTVLLDASESSGVM
jgi:hypothetical protein